MQDIELTGKRVLIRVDFNVPRSKTTGEITNDVRIQAGVPTIKYLVEQGAKVIIMTHMGRPKGEVKEELRLDSLPYPSAGASYSFTTVCCSVSASSSTSN